MWHDETKYENKKLKFGRAFYLYIRIACQSISTSYFSRFFCVCVRDRSPSYLICFSLLTVEEQTDFFLTNFLASFLVSCGRPPPPCYKISLTPGHSLILFLFLFFYIRVRCWVKTTATKSYRFGCHRENPGGFNNCIDLIIVSFFFFIFFFVSFSWW